MKVLLVEDDDKVRSDLGPFFEEKDIALSYCPTVNDAYDALKEHSFDCIVADCNKYGEDDFEQIREEYKDAVRLLLLDFKNFLKCGVFKSVNG